MNNNKETIFKKVFDNDVPQIKQRHVTLVLGIVIRNSKTQKDHVIDLTADGVYPFAFSDKEQYDKWKADQLECIIKTNPDLYPYFITRTKTIQEKK